MITQLTAENVKKLQAVSIRPDGSPVILTGENEAGKSTVLDCIWIALTGQTPDQPIRNGSKKARIELSVQINDEETPLVIERRFTGKGSYITVKDDGGKARTSPQKLLDGLTSTLTLDPLAFSRMKPKEQRETLLRLSGLDLTDWEKRYKDGYEARTIANREATQKVSAWKGLADAPEGTPEREQSAADLIAEIEEMQGQRKAREDAEGVRRGIERDQADCNAKIGRLERELEAAGKEMEDLNAAARAHKVPEAPTEEAVAEKRKKLSTIEEVNRNVRYKLTKEAAKDVSDKAQRLAQQAERNVQKLLEEKEALIKKADFGIDGIEIDDDGVLFEGQPLAQQSSARTMEISARIAMRGDPRFKVLIIRDASLIGTKIFQRIAEMADEKGYQLWVERFQEEPGDHGVHIIDGSVAFIDGQATEDATTPEFDDEGQNENDEDTIDL